MARQPRVDETQKQSKTYTDDKGVEHINHYKQPEEGNALAGIDYARLKDDNFKNYFDTVEGPRIVVHPSHSMPVRQGGMNRQKKYIFDCFMGFAIKKNGKDDEGNAHTSIVGVELKSTIPTNVNISMTLENATILNAQIGSFNNNYPGKIYLLDQTQEL